MISLKTNFLEKNKVDNLLHYGPSNQLGKYIQEIKLDSYDNKILYLSIFDSYY